MLVERTAVRNETNGEVCKGDRLIAGKETKDGWKAMLREDRRRNVKEMLRSPQTISIEHKVPIWKLKSTHLA